MLVAMDGPLTFLIPIVSMALVFGVVVGGMRAIEGDPRVVADGFVARGGIWVLGRQASWPFAELHVTPEEVRLRPRYLRFFAPVVLARGDIERIHQPWSPFGRGVRFEGAGVGRPVTFWPLRTKAVVEALRQLAWDVEPVGGRPSGAPVRVPSTERPPATELVPLAAPITYRAGALPLVLQLVPLVAIAVLAANDGFVIAVPMLAIALVGAATLVDRLECDGTTLVCRTLLWARRLPLEDVAAVEAPFGSTLVNGGVMTIAPRRGWRTRVVVWTARDRERYEAFRRELAVVAPWAVRG
jgi:hypothetical protein